VFVRFYTLTGVSPRDTPHNATLPGPWGGAFFPPPELSRYVAEWAVRSQDDLVLEPLCGEASFLLAAGERLTALRGSAPGHSQLAGVELHKRSAGQALALLRQADLPAAVTTGDFFPGAGRPPRSDPVARHLWSCWWRRQRMP